MSARPRILSSLCLSALMGMAGHAHAQKNIASGRLGVESGLAVDIRSVFQPMPPTGLAPVRVVATNETPADQDWVFDFSSRTQDFRSDHACSSRFTLRVPAGGTAASTWLVPVAVRYGERRVGMGTNHRLHIVMQAPGVETRDYHHYEERAETMPAVAISPALAEGSHTRLKQEAGRALGRSRGGELFGSEFATADLPEDWRGLSGFDYFMITDHEWLALKPGQRLAVIQWARLGGVLDLYQVKGSGAAGATAASLQLPGVLKEGRVPLSLGHARLFTWNGTSLETPSMMERYVKLRSALQRMETLRAGYADRSPLWKLLERLGKAPEGSWQVMLFLVAFGILVGPVNLFLLAPAGRRHRLFVTTPLISVATTLLLYVVILVQDGVGGEGARLAVVGLQPGEASAYVTQEQASRTGMLLGAGFDARQPMIIEPLALPPSSWVRLDDTNQTGTARLNLEGARHGGTYFQSRSMQAQLLRAVLPTRARLELKSGLAPGADPELVSTLGCTLDAVFYTDEQGQVWRNTQPLRTGQSAKLARSDAAALQKALAKVAEAAGGTLRKRLDVNFSAYPPSPGTFYATSSAPGPDFMLESLPSIRWQQDSALFFGPVDQP